MTSEQAIKHLSSGYELIPVREARAICKAFGVRYDPNEFIAMDWKTVFNIYLRYVPEEVGKITFTDDLAAFIARQLGIESVTHDDRAIEARMNAEAIAKMLQQN